MADGNMAGETGHSGARACLLVLGMHRSGTSALTRGLVALGAGLGDRLLPGDPSNPRGFFEDRDVCNYNMQFMEALGQTWTSLAPIPGERLLELARSLGGQAALQLVRSKVEGVPLPAFKDPRLCRLMPFWRPVLAAADLAPSCVLPLRHPDAVARSLERRDGILLEGGRGLWLRYTLDALDGSRGLPRIMVAYERLLAAPRREIARIGQAFGLPVDAEALAVFARDFLDTGLCHHGVDSAGSGEPTGHSPESGSFAGLSLRLYGMLERLAAAPQSELERALRQSRFLRLKRECEEALAEVGRL